MTALRFPQDGPPLGVELTARAAVVWEFGDAPRAVLRAEAPNSAIVTAADVSLEAGQLALGDDRGRVSVVALGTGAPVSSFETQLDQPVRHLTFSLEGNRLATQTASYFVGVWDVGNPERRHRVYGHSEGLWLIRFLPGGDRLVTAGRGSSIRVWQLGADREDLALLGHVGRVTALAVSPDGRTLVSGSNTGQVTLWDLRTGLDMVGLKRHTGKVSAVEFAPGGKWLLTGGTGDLAFWDTGNPK